MGRSFNIIHSPPKLQVEFFVVIMLLLKVFDQMWMWIATFTAIIILFATFIKCCHLHKIVCNSRRRNINQPNTYLYENS
jgi:hypothetical protein